MSTALIVGFLAVHALLHLAVWLPHPEPDPAKPPPFEPDHSVVLTAVAVPAVAVRRLASALAVGTCAAYLLAAVAVAVAAAWTVPVVVAAALAGMVLKGLYFHPWLSLGVLLDVLVLTSAVAGWPVELP